MRAQKVPSLLLHDQRRFCARKHRRSRVKSKKKTPPIGSVLFLVLREKLHVALVGLDHLLDHLAADGAGFAGGQVAVVAVLEIDTDLLWCSFTILKEKKSCICKGFRARIFSATAPGVSFPYFPTACGSSLTGCFSTSPINL